MTTCGCGQPVTDAYVCTGCTNQLAHDLAHVPALADELDTVLARQTVYGDRAGGRAAEHPLPYDPRASEAGWVLRDTLTAWVHTIAERRPAAPRGQRPGHTPADMARWLVGHVEWIRHQQDGGQAVDEIHDAVTAVRRVVDRPADRWYAGRCPCETDLYARDGAHTVTCPGCGTTYDVAERRDQLLAALEDVLATAPEIARGLSILDTPITAASIRGYAHRRRLAQRGTDPAGRPLYRVGDVLDLVTAEKARVS